MNNQNQFEGPRHPKRQYSSCATKRATRSTSRLALAIIWIATVILSTYYASGSAAAMSAVAVVSADGEDEALDAPIASPPGGVYGPHQMVVLSAAPGTTIRYTTDGSTPDEMSPVYAAPFEVASDMTVKAKAFATGWSPSLVMTTVYKLDSIPPTIVPSVFPMANAAGWNNMPVTVTFECSDTRSSVVTCPEAVVFDHEGANQEVSVTAQDGVGNQSTAHVAVSIDMTAPSVVLSQATSDGLTTAPVISISGAISDTVSGVATATCNDVPATIVDGRAECTVSLSLGMNAVILHAMDAAGHSSSAGVRVVRATGAPTTSLSIAPSVLTLVVGESRPMVATNDDGMPSTDVTWNSSDPNRLFVTVDGRVEARAPGQVTVTAGSNGVSAEASVTVMDTVLAAGTPKWTQDATPGLMAVNPIYATRIDASGADLFSVETDGNETTQVRAVRANGASLWSQAIGGIPLFGDVFGALVIAPASCWWCSGNNTIMRIGGSGNVLPWLYQADAGVSEYSIQQGIAQTMDGTIFLVENKQVPDGDVESSVVGLDGATGQLKFRAPLRANTSRVTSSSCLPADQLPPGTVNRVGSWFIPRNSRSQNSVSAISIDVDGAAYLEVVEEHELWTAACHLTEVPPMCDEGGCYDTRHYLERAPGEGTFVWEFTLKLLRVDKTGHMTTTTLWESAASGSDAHRNDWREGAMLGSVTPDGVGGQLASWIHIGEGGYETRITRVVAGAMSHHTVPMPTDYFNASPTLMVGDNGMAFVESYDTYWQRWISAIDVRTWETKWSVETWATPTMATAGGGVALQLESTQTVYDPDGSVVSSTEMAPGAMSSVLHMGSFEGNANGALTSVAGPGLAQAAFVFPNAQGQRAPRVLSITQFVTEDVLQAMAPQYIVEDFALDLAHDVFNGRQPRMLARSDADWPAFIDEVNGRRDAVAYFGHALEAPPVIDAQMQSVGFRVNISTRSTFAFVSKPFALPDGGVIAICGDPPACDPALNLYLPDGPIPSDARILFFGSCRLGDIFRSMWNISLQTKGRALVVPVGPVPSQVVPVDLKGAAIAWKLILLRLNEVNPSTGKYYTLGDAVDYANLVLPQGAPVHYSTAESHDSQFTVIGDRDVRLR